MIECGEPRKALNFIEPVRLLAPIERPPYGAAENPPAVQGLEASAVMGANIALAAQEDYNSGHD